MSAASPVVVLSALAQARAYLAREGEYELGEAVNGVHRYGAALGVPSYIVEMIVSEEFLTTQAMFEHARQNDFRFGRDE